MARHNVTNVCNQPFITLTHILQGACDLSNDVKSISFFLNLTLSRHRREKRRFHISRYELIYVYIHVNTDQTKVNV